MVVCVFGASSTRLDEKYILQVEKLGAELAKRGHSLVFGGGKNGLMGAAARGFKSENGSVVGVTPYFFKPKGVIYEQCDELIITDTMRERKAIMEDRADAFIVAPGGIGTYEEFFEVLTLKQLARHAKPIVLFNTEGFFDKIVDLIDTDIKNDFIREQTQSLFSVSADIEEVIRLIETDKTDINSIEFA